MKVFTALTGGLGNQMFQYATGRSLAKQCGAELVLDNWSGFVRDHQYHRHYELGALPIQGRSAHPIERLPIWIYRWMHSGGRYPNKSLVEKWYGDFFVELPNVFSKDNSFSHFQFNYQPQFLKLQHRNSIWLVGQWQSPHYFEDIATSLKVELMPSTPFDNRFRSLGEELQSCESVAVGVRLYEESANPGVHAYGGALKGVGEIRSAITRMRCLRPRARFFVFCTHHAPLLDQLELPTDTMFVTHDAGYTGSLERLWLLTRCRHHLFTNSSYYWWGAWLSAAVRCREQQYIIAADNFINRDGLCASWQRF